MTQGTLFIVAAPSGAGKTSLVRRLISEDDSVQVSVSHTTRPMRDGEEDGVNYHFVSVEEFETMAAAGGFLEHAKVFDRYYGTSEQWVRDQLQKGIDVILEIDWQGARQARQQIDNTVGIFILPPSREILEQRLRDRNQDSEEVIARRMRDAVSEMQHYVEFDYLIVNDDFERALADLKSVIRSRRLATERRADELQQLIDNLLK